MDKILNYAKTVAAAAGGLVTAVNVATADEAISFTEARGIWTAVLLLATAVGVYAIPNKQPS